jgi:hypothetical protein
MCSVPSCTYWCAIFFSSRTFSCHTQNTAQSKRSASTTAGSDFRRMKSLLPTLRYVQQINQSYDITGILSWKFCLFTLSVLQVVFFFFLFFFWLWTCSQIFFITDYVHYRFLEFLPVLSVLHQTSMFKHARTSYFHILGLIFLQSSCYTQFNAKYNQQWR